MKLNNKTLLEHLIRCELFELNEQSQTIKSIIVPWTGNKLSRMLNKSGKGAVAGFTITIKGVPDEDLVKYIAADSSYGYSSKFSNGNYVYIASTPTTHGNKTTWNVTIFDNTSKYYMKDIFKEYQSLYNKIPSEQRRRYNLPDTVIFTTNRGYIRKSDFIETKHLPYHDQLIQRLTQSIDLMNQIGPDLAVVGQEKIDLERRVRELEQALSDITSQSGVSVPTPVSPADQQQQLISVTNNSDSEIIRQLQRDIIQMINNNPEIYPTDTQYKQIFDDFIKKYKDDGTWGKNMSSMVQLINLGFEQGNSMTQISSDTYKLIKKYQTSKIK